MKGEGFMDLQLDTKKVDLRVKMLVFLPPWIILVAMVVISLVNNKAFLAGLNAITDWILDNFAWAFNATTLLCVVTVIIVYFSPFGNVRIGGSKQKPIMKYSNWVWITLCTTIAAGILFWGCAEPMYHLYNPSATEGIEPGSKEAALFAMKIMFLEWSWSPYALYTVATIVFGFVFYNMKKSYSLGSALIPLFGDKVSKYNNVIDVVCLFALVTGMAASLGTGTMIIAGGIENILGIKSNSVSWGFIIIVIVATFVISSISGMMKGIRILSSINAKVYIALLLFMLIFGPRVFMLNLTIESLGAFLADFPRLSLMTGELYDDRWSRYWPIFYWCNWLAWTPISAVFLGSILKGYTIKDAIRCNFIIPSIFGIIWMGIFSSASLFYEFKGLGLFDLMNVQGAGPEAVVYRVFEQLPVSLIIIPFYVFIVFISFVTASDSNTTAMAGLCTSGISQEATESPAFLKIIWGVTIAAVTWILISSAGISGIKAASNLGGFPNMFLMIIMCVGLLKICRNPKKYDVFKEDYNENGVPLKTERLPIDPSA